MKECSGKGIDNTVSDIEGMEVRATRGLELLAVEDKESRANCRTALALSALLHAI